MDYTIYITSSAIIDIEKALEYYNSKIADLGFRFADNVDKSFQAILRNPSPFQYDIKM